jgi:hypothetical protein
MLSKVKLNIKMAKNKRLGTSGFSAYFHKALRKASHNCAVRAKIDAYNSK